MMTVAGSAEVGMDGSMEPMKLFVKKVQGYSEVKIDLHPGTLNGFPENVP